MVWNTIDGGADVGIIEVKDYHFSYPGSEKKALKSINFAIHSGDFVVLCGKSGCGKSTLLRQFKSVLTPNGEKKGTILFAGTEICAISPEKQSSQIGFVMQDPDNQLVTDKVWHELAFGMESLGYDTPTIRLRVAEMASYFGIQQWFHKNVEELSGGQKQLLNLAAVMTLHPSLLILDEPTAQLDPIAASEFIDTIRKINRELGTTILVTEHRLEELIPIADQVILMDEGEITCQGSPQETVAWMYHHRHEMFEAMPAPAQIFAYASREHSSKQSVWPMTVRDGRKWLENIQPQRGLAGHQLPNRNGDIIIDTKDVWFRYGKDLPDVVRGLSLKIRKGEFYCLLGGNGTGKSTTLSLLCRLYKPGRGKIKVGGKDIRKYSSDELYDSFLGVVPQNPKSLFVKKTVRLELYEMIGGTAEGISKEFPIDMEKREAIQKIAEITQLDHLMEQHPYDLSGGEQQRLALAKILLLRPKILLLDEPTKGLDAAFKKEFAEILLLLKEAGVTILMISHDIEFCARYADRCGLFFDGYVVTENEPNAFFSGNSFYTTTANRMARQVYPDAVTVEDVLNALQRNR